MRIYLRCLVEGAGPGRDTAASSAEREIVRGASKGLAAEGFRSACASRDGAEEEGMVVRLGKSVPAAPVVAKEGRVVVLRGTQAQDAYV